MIGPAASLIAPAEWVILSTSFAVAIRAVLWSLPFAVAAAWALSRPRLPGKLILDALAHLPLILPPVLVGFLLLVLVGRAVELFRYLRKVVTLLHGIGLRRPPFPTSGSQAS